MLGDNYKSPLMFYQNLRYVIVFLISIFNFKGLLNNSTKLLLPFICFSLISTILFFDFNIIAYLKIVSYFLITGSIFNCIKTLITCDQIKTINYLFYFFLTFCSINILLIPFSHFYFSSFRFMGVFANPNGLAMAICGILPFVVYSKHEGLIQIRKTYFYLFIGIIFIMMILTASRTSLISLLMFIILVFKSRVKILLIFLIVLFFFFYYLDLININFINDIEIIVNVIRFDTISTASGRLDIWSVAFKEILKNPIFGNGFTYDVNFIQNYGISNFGINYPREYGGIWNSYLSLLLNTGILGLLSYLFFLFKMWQLSINKRFATAILLMFCLIGFSESWMMSSLNILFPLMILNWSLLQQKLIK